MKFKILIPILLFCLIQSCKNKESKQENNSVENNIELAEKSRLDSITKIEEKIAIGKINFGINQDEYLKKKEEFLKLTNGKFGKYEFRMSESFDDNGGLKYIWLNGDKVHYDYYDRDMLDEFISLKEILVEKYGAPTTIYLDSFPRWTDFDKGESKDIYHWSIGNKSIFVSVVFPDEEPAIYFQLNVSFGYNTPEELDKWIKETEQKEKEAIEKAVKSL